MRFIRRATQRAASFTAAIASVFLLATCDLDKIVNVDTSKAVTLDSTDLVVTIPGTDLTIGGTATATVATTGASGIDLDETGATIRFSSSDATVISIDSSSGLMTAIKVGTSVIRARILAPELGAGVTHSKSVRVRYKGVKVVTPVPVDSLTGLGQTRSISVQGTNFTNGLVTGALTADSLRVRIAGVNDTSLLRLAGTTITAKKSGTSYVFAFFDGFKDSVAVKVRQVAKTVTFPTVDYTARHLNFNLTVPVNVTDIADSVIPPAAQIITWGTKDTTRATIGTSSGVLRVKSVLGDSVFATMDGINRRQRIVVSQVAGSLTKFAGDAQSDTVALPIAVVPTVTVLDSGSTPIVGASVKFRAGIGLNATVTDTLQVTDANGRAKPTSWKLGDLVGAQTLVATSGAQTTTFNATALHGAPRKLAFSVNPTSATIGTTIAPGIKVTIQDSLGNTVTSSTANVTLSISFNPGAASLAGTLTQPAVAGVATFNNISLNAGGSGYSLQASSGVLTAAISNGFDIYGNAAKLGFTTQPAGTSAGATMSTIRVAIQDASGTTVSNSTASITLAVSAGPGGAVLAGTTTVAAVAGVAEFTTLSLTPAGSGYILQATSPTLTGTTSNSFVIAAVGAPSQLAFSVHPTNVVASTAIAPAIKVRVLDASGALVTTSSQQITLSIEATSPTGATLAGVAAQNAIQGVATFSDISLNKAGTGYKLQATAAGTSLTVGVSTAFNVTAGVATKLGFVQQPTNTQFGQTISPAVTVELQDAGGNRVTTGSAVAVTLATTGGTCTGATLSGNAPTNTVSGVATFSVLSLSAAAASCTLTATASLLTQAISTTFASTTATGAAKLSFTTEPSPTAGAGSNLGVPPTVAIQDAAGNNITASSTSITLSVLSGPQTFFSNGGGTQSTTTNTTFNAIRFNKAGQYRLLASATGLDPDTSAIITVSPTTADRLGFTQQPGNTVAGVPFPQTVTVSFQDQYGNTVSGLSNSVEISYYRIGGSPTQLFLNTGSAQATVAAVNGVATFTGLAPRTAGTAMYLVPRSTGFIEAQSSTFIVTPAPASKIGFAVHPPSFDTVGTPLAPAIQASGQDSVGNTIADFSNAITVALTGGAAGAVLSGTKTVPPTGGISTFSDLSIDKTGTGYQLSASASGMTTGTSNTFTIEPHFLSNTGVCCEEFAKVGDTVYVVHSNALKKVLAAGGTVTNIVGSTNATAITTDGTNIYWAERGTNNNGDAFIKKLTVSNGTVSTLTVGLANLMDDAASRMYSDGVNVYFIARNVPGNGYAIKSIPVGAVSGTPVDVYTPSQFTNPNFLLSGGLIYFYDPSVPAIRRMTTTGASLTTLSTGSVTGQRFALAGTTLYFNDGVTIKSIPNAPSAGSGVAPTTHLTAPGTVYEVNSNGGLVYVNFDGSLRRYTADFSSFVELNADAVQWHPNFDFDGTYLYFMHEFGRIARISK